jgi:4-hydroxy-tetrahydrodipicolinate synthase
MIKQIPAELSGVFAALPTPFGPEGNILWEALDALVDHVVASGVKHLCLGGATGEYAACGVEQRVEMFARVARRVDGKARLLCAVGAEHAGQVRQLARAAAGAGAMAVLFPPPAYFSYAQNDLMDFVAQVSADLPLPVLLYHIPQCTRDLGIANVLRLIADIPNVIGLKDSSGVRSNMSAIAAAQAQTPLVFLTGRDELFVEAFAHGAVGVISGIAGVCPELLLPLYGALRAGRKEQAQALQARVDEFISHFGNLPAPWIIKLAFEVRGLEMGCLAWPMAPGLSKEASEFKNWFAAHLSNAAGATHPSGN